MKRLLLLLSLCIPAYAVPVAPAVIPHITFVNGVGAPCAGCKLSTFSAGTTSPLATYTDATGTSTNTNPIVLDAAGGANIWLGSNSYKFVLKDAAGATIWTVDQVNAGNLFPCGPAHTIQASNGAVNGLECDASITINTTNHTISVGTLPANHVTIGALGTPTSWNFDTTSPDTARTSIGAGTVGAGTINQIAAYPATGTAIQGYSALPAGVTVITQSPDDNSGNPASTAYVALPGAISPTSLALAAGTAMTDNQGTGVKVQHSTGTTTTDDYAKFDSAGNVVDAGASSTPITGTITITSQSLSSNTCFTQTVTMSAAVPAGHVTLVSLAVGSTGTGELPATVQSISGSSVTVAWCNNFVGTVTLVAGTYNLGVL